MKDFDNLRLKLTWNKGIKPLRKWVNIFSTFEKLKRILLSNTKFDLKESIININKNKKITKNNYFYIYFLLYDFIAFKISLKSIEILRSKTLMLTSIWTCFICRKPFFVFFCMTTMTTIFTPNNNSFTQPLLT